MAIIGGAGMLSVSIVLPIIGRWYDNGIAARTPAGAVSLSVTLSPVSKQRPVALEALGQGGTPADDSQRDLRLDRGDSPQ